MAESDFSFEGFSRAHALPSSSKSKLDCEALKSFPLEIQNEVHDIFEVIWKNSGPGMKADTKKKCIAYCVYVAYQKSEEHKIDPQVIAHTFGIDSLKGARKMFSYHRTQVRVPVRKPNPIDFISSYGPYYDFDESQSRDMIECARKIFDENPALVTNQVRQTATGFFYFYLTCHLGIQVDEEEFKKKFGVPINTVKLNSRRFVAAENLS